MSIEFWLKYFCLLYVGIGSLLLVIATQLDDRYPSHPINKRRFKLHKDSFLRNILKINDSNEKPCIASKIYASFFSVVICILIILFYLIDMIGKGFLSHYFNNDLKMFMSRIIALCSMIYAASSNIIFDFLDNKYYKNSK